MSDDDAGAEEAKAKAIEAHWDTTKTSNNEMWEQKRRLADAMRLVIERLVPSNAPIDELRLAAEGLERYAEALRAHPRLIKVMGRYDNHPDLIVRVQAAAALIEHHNYSGVPLMRSMLDGRKHIPENRSIE